LREIEPASFTDEIAAKLGCLFLDNCIPLQNAAVVADPCVGTFTKKFKETSFRFSPEAVTIIITNKARSPHIQHARFEGLNRCYIQYPTERFLKIVHERLLPLVAAGLMEEAYTWL